MFMLLSSHDSSLVGLPFPAITLFIRCFRLCDVYSVLVT